MSQSKPGSPQDSTPNAQGEAAPASRNQSDQAERLAAALRDNLKRRKAQARARTQPEPSGTKPGPHRP